MSSTKPKTLREILEDHYEHQWRHMRSGKTLYSQAKAAVEDIEQEVFSTASVMTVGYGAAPLRDASGKAALRVSLYPKDVQEETLRLATKRWYEEGLSPATITKRLNCLSVLGVNVEGTRPPKERKLKWWLRPEERERALDWLEDYEHHLAPYRDLRLLIEWTCTTGLRIEESLALTRGCFNATLDMVSVPGLKTATSQATLPLSCRAKIAADYAFFPDASRFPSNSPFICHTYRDLAGLWVSLREAMGWPKEATLKGLRRTAARYLHVDCGMPLDMVRQYLRHEDIATTMEYLRLTGGYEVEEMRRYL